MSEIKAGGFALDPNNNVCHVEEIFDDGTVFVSYDDGGEDDFRINELMPYGGN
jgi:hypothetical protein